MLSFGADMLFRIPALLMAITVHEYAHGQVSYSLGDPTPKVEGRLTLNPLAHLDPLGAMMLVIAGFGWAKPVNINTRYYRNLRQGILKVAFAGPAANLFLCALALFLLVFLGRMGLLSNGVRQFLIWLELYNVWFAFFNLIPLPPLDGSKILMCFLSSKQAYEYSRIERYSFYILIALVFTGVVSMIITPLANAYLLLVEGLLRIFL